MLKELFDYLWEHRWKTMQVILFYIPVGILLYTTILYTFAERMASEKCLRKGTTGYVVTYELKVYCTGMIGGLSYANELGNYYDGDYNTPFFDIFEIQKP